MCKVIICDLDHKDIEPELKVFGDAGLEVKWLHCRSQKEVIEKCKKAVVLLNQYIKMDKEIFTALPNVKCIVRYGVGYDNINLNDAKKYGVQACNIPDYGTREVADQALAFGLVNRVWPAEDLQREAEAAVAALAAGPTLALGRAKALLRDHLQVGLDEALAGEAAAQVASGQTKDHAEGVAAFLEKRPPTFQGA